MDLIVWLIVEIVRALSGEKKPAQTPLPNPAPVGQPAVQRPAVGLRAQPARRAPMAFVGPIRQDPLFRASQQLLVLVLLGLLVVLGLGAAWLLYTLGLPHA